ncbi:MULTISPECIES: TetR/AcrR family transcriptional regulator [Mycobacteroides]|uniref:TetR/AcrR family transcriptional regulator n=1 Tax=Mycobacteroides TaxID=670516 RepID=UPI00071237F2|nr:MULTISPECIES: TetR/AcrR family transcriptional regulator [Mycobacteroides]KRQ18699.1 TetR family transcriptional regulator [Mycobacteroides sp. H003]KRQ30375.1 TetR family transcriptional regulator [Mycobacteroides sp. H092]KRQ36357.1 TetR family transcriptional regulator [Mycobacteroides sp. H101]KRQ49534.1 TetR family transcriptional regulator [Mycobacteroides sp. H063]KRQ55855.1 TetR family transcriptional regulator [Mycobacteroides sp. HXVII]
MSGRPRRTSPIREGKTTRDEILDASAELFTTDGFAATTTRRIAESVGVQQASLYYHFKTKDDILDALLAMTIDQPLHYAGLIADRPEAPVVRLYALALADAAQLAASRWNLGALYLLPDLRADRFAVFRGKRDQLRTHYQDLAAAAGRADMIRDGVERLPFRLVESVIMLRADGDSISPEALADATLRVLGVAEDAQQVEGSARALLRQLDWPVAVPKR